MILVDANLLLYAVNSEMPAHDRAREWWDEQLSGTAPVCLCWPVINAFLRLGTNPRVFARALTQKQATERVAGWLDQPCVRVVAPTENHWRTFKRMLERSQATGNLVTDAHLAALAYDHGCVLCSADSDFAKFPGLKWQNPIA